MLRRMLFLFILSCVICSVDIYSQEKIVKVPRPGYEPFKPNAGIYGEDKISGAFEEYKDGKATGEFLLFHFKLAVKKNWNGWKLYDTWYLPYEQDKTMQIIQTQYSSSDEIYFLKIIEWIPGKRIHFVYDESFKIIDIEANKETGSHKWSIVVKSTDKEYDGAPMMYFTYKEVEKIEMKYNTITIY